MQREGSPQFIQAHSGAVKGVAFSPKNRYVFCSGGSDGKINLYDVRRGQQIKSTRITSPHPFKNVTNVKFTSCGSRILSTTAKRLSVIDVERGQLITSYDNCAYSGKDSCRTPLASDPQNPYLAISCCTNGKGLITFDLRSKQPVQFSLNVHSSLIRDIIYLDGSWPFGDNNHGSVVSLSLDGVCKIRTVDDREIHAFDVKHRSNSVTATPYIYSYTSEDGFEPTMMIGGDNLSGYIPDIGHRGDRLISFGPSEKPIWNLKYTSNGGTLYATTMGGQLRRYRRIGQRYHCESIYNHDDEISDFDISPIDEYVVTASKDGTVGLMCLGAPSLGWSGFFQLA